MLRTNRQIDIAFLLIVPIFASVVSLLINANSLTSTFLFLGFPAIWLSFRVPHLIKDCIVYSALGCSNCFYLGLFCPY